VGPGRCFTAHPDPQTTASSRTRGARTGRPLRRRWCWSRSPRPRLPDPRTPRRMSDDRQKKWRRTTRSSRAAGDPRRRTARTRGHTRVLPDRDHHFFHRLQGDGGRARASATPAWAGSIAAETRRAEVEASRRRRSEQEAKAPPHERPALPGTGSRLLPGRARGFSGYWRQKDAGRPGWSPLTVDKHRRWGPNRSGPPCHIPSPARSRTLRTAPGTAGLKVTKFAAVADRRDPRRMIDIFSAPRDCETNSSG